MKSESRGKESESKGELRLRPVLEDDLPILFEHHRDPEAVRQVAFLTRDPEDRGAFLTHWRRILADDSIVIRTVLFREQVVGYVLGFEREGQPEVGYWFGREHWGQGLATRALRAFLEELPQRPVQARVAADHPASIRVLEKCGFTLRGRESAFSKIRGEQVEELIMELARADGESG